MGTRGCYGFRMNGKDYLTYNHSDSYPEWLGRHIVDFCRKCKVDEMRRIVGNIELVQETENPTKEELEELGLSTDDEGRDWYWVLRQYQGELGAYKQGLCYMTDANNFIKDSLCCEYAYIINLDTCRLEFWKGFQKKPDETNRYGTESDCGYYPCKRVKTYLLKVCRESADTVVDDMVAVNEKLSV